MQGVSSSTGVHGDHLVPNVEEVVAVVLMNNESHASFRHERPIWTSAEADRSAHVRHEVDPKVLAWHIRSSVFANHFIDEHLVYRLGEVAFVRKRRPCMSADYDVRERLCAQLRLPEAAARVTLAKSCNRLQQPTSRFLARAEYRQPARPGSLTW